MHFAASYGGGLAFGSSGDQVGFGSSAAFRVQSSSSSVAPYPAENSDAPLSTTNLSHGFPLQRLPFAIQELLGMRSGHQHQSLQALPCSCPVDGPSSLQNPSGFNAGSVPTPAGPGSPLEHRQYDAFAQHFHYVRGSGLLQSSPAGSPGANYLAGRVHDWRSSDRGIEEGIRRVAAADMTVTTTTTCQGGNVLTDPISYGYGSSQQKTTSSLQGFRSGQPMAAASYYQDSCSGAPTLVLFVAVLLSIILLCTFS